MKYASFAAALLASALAAPALAQPAPPPPPREPTLAEACPNLTAKERAGIENYRGKFAENALYARAYCVPVAEAERRMEIQNRGAIGPRIEPGPRPAPPENDIGTVNAALQEKEAATFAGIWIQHQPDYRVVVAFTRNAAATLAKYTKDPLFKPLDRPGPTLRELRATQDRLMKLFSERGYRWSGAGAREDQGVVEITLAQEAAPIRAAAARGEFELPSWVRLVEPRPLPFPAPPPARAGDTRVRAFPQFAHRTDMYPRTLVGVPDVPATLRLVDGCLVLDLGGETRTALWQASDALDLSDPSRVTVLDRLSGRRVAAGEDIVLEGLQPNEEQVPKDIAGAEGCPGPYRVVRGFLPRAEWDAQRRKASLDGRIREFGNEAAALADYEADQARLATLRRWRERMLAERGEKVAAIYIDEEQGTAHVYHTPDTTPAALAGPALSRFVTGQPVPRGFTILEAVRASLVRQLADAQLKADVRIEPHEGVVEVRPADLRLLSAAAAAGRVRFPEHSRVAFDPSGPIMDEALMRSRDPESIWLRLETAPDFAAIRRHVEATDLPVIEPGPPPRRPGEAASTEPPPPPRVRRVRPSRAASLSTAQFLVAYGQSAREIAHLKARGFDPVDAFDAMNGRPTPVTRAILARQVVVGELVAIDTKDRGADGYRSTAQWRVVETLKGDAKPGETLRVRMVSGEEPDGRIAQSNEEPLILPGFPGSLQPGGRWLLHLNDSLYGHLAFIHGGEKAARRDGRWYIPTFTPAPVVGDEVKATFFGQEGFRLEELRNALAPLQAAVLSGTR